MGSLQNDLFKRKLHVLPSVCKNINRDVFNIIRIKALSTYMYVTSSITKAVKNYGLSRWHIMSPFVFIRILLTDRCSI